MLIVLPLAASRDVTVLANTGNGGSEKYGNGSATVSYSGSKTVNFKIEKGKTSFKVRASKKKIRTAAPGNRKVTVRIKVSGLSKGSSKAGFAIKNVSNGQRSKVNVNKKSGKVTIKPKTKKCTIDIKVSSKANKNHKSKTKSIKIKVI